LPASVLALRHYHARTFTSDLIAGVTVGLVALPLAMAFAISSSMSPEAGILCGALPQPARMMAKAEFHRHVGEENILPDVAAALERAEEVWRERG
jgi:MFS superfamily sulfate permease-like transporter